MWPRGTWKLSVWHRLFIWCKNFKAGSISSQQHLPLPPAVRTRRHRTGDALSEKFSIGHCFSLSLQMSLLQTSSLYEHEHPLKLVFLMGVKLPPSAAQAHSSGWQSLPVVVTWSLAVTSSLQSILWSPTSHCTTVPPCSSALLFYSVTPFLLHVLFQQSNPSLHSLLWCSKWPRRAHL